MSTKRRTATVHRPGGRPAARYRFSDQFIRRATAVLLIIMSVVVATGVVLGLVADSLGGDAVDTLGNLGGGLVVGGLLVPLLVAAILGGEAIKAGGGFLGFGLVLGVALVALLPTVEALDILGAWRVPLHWAGWVLIVACGIGFFIIGFIAKVPMWLRAPFLDSPGFSLHGRSERDGGANLTAHPDRNEPRSRR
jgi:hypothetical protein